MWAHYENNAWNVIFLIRSSISSFFLSLYFTFNCYLQYGIKMLFRQREYVVSSVFGTRILEELHVWTHLYLIPSLALAFSSPTLNQNGPRVNTAELQKQLASLCRCKWWVHKLKGDEQEGNVNDTEFGCAPSPTAEIWQVLVLHQFAKARIICPYKPMFSFYSFLHPQLLCEQRFRSACKKEASLWQIL